VPSKPGEAKLWVVAKVAEVARSAHNAPRLRRFFKVVMAAVSLYPRVKARAYRLLEALLARRLVGSKDCGWAWLALPLTYWSLANGKRF
jgi:hypothetical protein